MRDSLQARISDLGRYIHAQEERENLHLTGIWEPLGIARTLGQHSRASQPGMRCLRRALDEIDNQISQDTFRNRENP